MPAPSRSTQTTHEALAWFKDFHAIHGRLPGVNETDALRGPTSRLIRRLGGLPGVAAKLELERTALPVRQQYTDEELVESLRDWAIRKQLDRAPFSEEAIADFQNGDPIIASGETFRERFGGWDNALAATGHYTFDWSPADCVAATARARRAHPDLNTRKAVQANANRGLVPGVKDVLGHYPDFRTVVRDRLSWESWQDRTGTLDATRRNIVGTTSLGVLALATVEGNMSYFEDGVRMLHKDDRGPEFSRELFATLDTRAKSTTSGYVWALDVIERVHDQVVGGEKSRGPQKTLALDHSGLPSSYTQRSCPKSTILQLFNNTFLFAEY